MPPRFLPTGRPRDRQFYLHNPLVLIDTEKPPHPNITINTSQTTYSQRAMLGNGSFGSVYTLTPITQQVNLTYNATTDISQQLPFNSTQITLEPDIVAKVIHDKFALTTLTHTTNSSEIMVKQAKAHLASQPFLQLLSDNQKKAHTDLEQEREYASQYYTEFRQEIELLRTEARITIEINTATSISHIYAYPGLCLLLPKLQGVTGYEFVHGQFNKPNYSFSLFIKIMAELVSSYDHLHKNHQFIHGDAHWGNWKIDPTNNYKIMLFDFGLSVWLPKNEAHSRSKTKRIAIAPNTLSQYPFHRSARFYYANTPEPELVEVGPEDDAFGITQCLKKMCAIFIKNYFLINKKSHPGIEMLFNNLTALYQLLNVTDSNNNPVIVKNSIQIISALIQLTEALTILSTTNISQLNPTGLAITTSLCEQAEASLNITRESLSKITGQNQIACKIAKIKEQLIYKASNTDDKSFEKNTKNLTSINFTTVKSSESTAVFAYRDKVRPYIEPQDKAEKENRANAESIKNETSNLTITGTTQNLYQPKQTRECILGQGNKLAPTDFRKLIAAFSL